MAEFDLEAVNRLRASLGLKPAGPAFKESSANEGSDEEQASTLATREAAASDNWKRLKDEQDEKTRRKAQKNAIRKAKEVAGRSAKITGTTFAEENDSLDTKTWLRQQAKRQKKIENARKLEEELAAREKQAEYTEKDLAGVKVGHEVDQFEGSEQILTLKDNEIGEESEDDELENIDLREQEKLKDKLELKKRKPVYNPHDQDESGEKKILAQYDEEISGQKKSQFTLDGEGRTREMIMADAGERDGKQKRVVISLDFLKEDKPLSDYVEAIEIKVKKSKKKKSKSVRKKDLDDEDLVQDVEDSMEVDSIKEPIFKKRSLADTNFVDDDDLQTRLAQQRRDALKKRKRTKPEDFARQMQEDDEAQMDGVVEEAEEAIVLDDTSEFVRHLHAYDEEEEKPARRATQNNKQSDSESDDDDGDGDIKMESYSALEESAEVKEEQAADGEITTTGLEEEGTISQGVGAALALLRQRHIIKDDDPKGEKNKSYRDHARFIAEKAKIEAKFERETKEERESDRKSGRLDRMSARDREEYAKQRNTQREQRKARDLAELTNRHYMPNLNLEYKDDTGRDMNQKEAFKHMSHIFHGKGSGKGKTEKKLKKIEEEKQRESMNALDNSNHVSTSAIGNVAKSNRQAGVRLQ